MTIRSRAPATKGRAKRGAKEAAKFRFQMRLVGGDHIDVEEDDYDNSVQQCGGRLRDVFIWTAQQFFGRIVREAATDVWKFFRGCCSELMTMEDEE